MMKRKVEDYMKTIYALIKTKGHARGSDVAKELNVSKPTVCVSLKNLQNEGYLKQLEDHSVVLTPKGMAIAREISDRNDSIFHMLVSLGVDEKTAAIDACHMEHAISQESFCALILLSESSNNIKKEKSG